MAKTASKGLEISESNRKHEGELKTKKERRKSKDKVQKDESKSRKKKDARKLSKNLEAYGQIEGTGDKKEKKHKKEKEEKKHKKEKGEKRHKKEKDEKKHKREKEEKKHKKEKEGNKDKKQQDKQPKETPKTEIAVDGLDSEQQNKFLRLMGAKKSSAGSDIKITTKLSSDHESTSKALEKQYNQGLVHKSSSKRSGLGANY